MMPAGVPANRSVRNTVKDNPRWIVLGPGRRFPHDWAAVLTISLECGWAWIRKGDELIGYPADQQEGTA